MKEYDPLAETIIRKATRTAEPAFNPVQDGNGNWYVEIPSDGSGGTQIFRGLNTRDLAAQLAKSVYHATIKIHSLTRIIKTHETDGPDAAERRFEVRRLAGEFGDDF